MIPKASWLADVHAACFTTPRPWNTAEFTGLLQDRHIVVVDCEDGFALGRVVTNEAELLSIAVLPNARRRGVGRTLMRRFEQLVYERDAARIFLEVGETNTPAITFYQTFGFQQTGRRARYYLMADGQRTDALIFTKPTGGAASG